MGGKAVSVLFVIGFDLWAAHSPTGIMRARWTEERLREHDREYFRFTHGEAESTRSEVRRRSMAANVADTSYLRVTYQQSPRPASWETYLDHALQLQKEGHYRDAEEAYASAMREAERLGLDDPAVARVYMNLGRLRNLQHDYSAARMAFERSLRIAEKAFGQDYFAAGLIMNIAITYQQQGQYGAAEPLYRRALCILESTPGPAHPYTAVAETAMAKLLLIQHRNTEAEALLNKAVAVFESSHEPDDQNLSIALVCLAEAYRTDGRYAKAEPLYRRALAIVEGRPTLRTDEISVGLTHFPPMLRRMKRKAEARELDAQIRKILPKPQGGGAQHGIRVN
jgi:tetratricopeptide (TPR) repeat protein